MSPRRVGCAARGLYRDRHQAVDCWWTLVSPEGDFIVLCSAAYVLEWICYDGLRTEANVALLNQAKVLA